MVMSDRLPETVDPFALAASGSSQVHSFPVNRFERATELLSGEHGVAEIWIKFGIDASGISYLSGTLSAEMQLPCQRCFESMTVAVESDFEMGLIHDEEESEALPEQYEPLLVEGEVLSLTRFIEDELILAIPVVAIHDPDECEASRYLQDETVVEDGEKRENPFQVLEQLKR